jgi:hypothetical protein
MNIPDNVLKAKLKNVYFIWGGGCAGKTTTAQELVKRHGFYLYSTDNNRRKHVANALPEYQPALCRNVPDVFALDPQDSSQWEVQIVREFTPMVVADLIELSALNKGVICEGDIDIDAIMPIITNVVTLSYWGSVPRDFFARPEQKNMLDNIRNRNDITDDGKEKLIYNAYILATGHEPGFISSPQHETPREVMQYGVKHIVTDETTTIEQMVNMVEEALGL